MATPGWLGGTDIQCLPAEGGLALLGSPSYRDRPPSGIEWEPFLSHPLLTSHRSSRLPISDSSFLSASPDRVGTGPMCRGPAAWSSAVMGQVASHQPGPHGGMRGIHRLRSVHPLCRAPHHLFNRWPLGQGSLGSSTCGGEPRVSPSGQRPSLRLLRKAESSVSFTKGRKPPFGVTSPQHRVPGRGARTPPALLMPWPSGLSFQTFTTI